ncbi:uncharacterized protein LOC121641681 isoform X2 [Melanotaenia boesemani]|uniref:uncharacterized protein LOC121641681 isoform X2 n=1 Tax=Melanotaenia boesemani TaxID=1250792 RepID=UPI001C04302E|nr:uncharacterized protein LOC121641681 isoform X2 [Melanotaenia boesemani]
MRSVPLRMGPPSWSSSVCAQRSSNQCSTCLQRRKMLNIVLFKLHHGFFLTRWRWTFWMLILCMLSGSLSLVTVEQPPVLVVALRGDAILPCKLCLSPDEKLEGLSILYWHFSPHHSSKMELLISSGEVREDVIILDNDQNSSNKSILLKNVQWDNSGKYQCKLSVKTEANGSFRTAGNQTTLVIYDTMSFNLTGHNNSVLRCEVNVSSKVGFALSIVHNGGRLKTTKRVVTAQTHDMLSETISLQEKEKYKCQLHFGEALITETIFPINLPDTEMYPEPWLLYSAVLLVPIVVLLSLLIAMLMRR